MEVDPAAATPRVRVLAVTTDLRLTGAKRVLVDGAVGIRRDRFDPSVLLLSPTPDDDPLRLELERAGVAVRHVPVRSRLDVRGVRALSRFLLREPVPDVVHTHCGRSAGAVRLAVLGRRPRPRVVLHFHGTVDRRSTHWRHRLLDQVLRPATDLVLAPTGHSLVRGERVHGFRGVESRVLHNGVDLSAFGRPPRPRDAVRRAWGVGPDERVVLLLGRWGWTKGQDLLLDAIPDVLAHGEPVRFVFVGPEGGGDYRLRLQRAASGAPWRDRVVFAGREEDPASAYHAADVVTMPSRDEPFGLVAVESMACGIPLVAARVPGLREVGGDDAGVEWVVPADAAALAAAVRRLLEESPAERAARAARLRARAALFSSARYVDGLERAYARVLGRADLEPGRVARSPRAVRRGEDLVAAALASPVPDLGGWRATNVAFRCPPA